jgi:hypothetical protein
MIIPPESQEKSTIVKPPPHDEGTSFPDQVRLILIFDPTVSSFTHSIYLYTLPQSPPPYSPPQGSSTKPLPPLNLPPDLAPTNYIHIKERNNSVKQRILLDLSLPRPPASTLPVPAVGQDEYTQHLLLDSHNGAVSGEVWLLSANREDTASHEVRKSTRERVHLYFGSHNGSVKAQVVRGLG